jgi:glucose-6-phosphate-specific signal transduction histidine kinase
VVTESKPPALDAMLRTDELTAQQADQVRWRYGFLVVVFGIIAILIAFGAAVFATQESVVLFAGLAGVVGTIMGAYFGIQAGQSGKAKVEAELARSQELVVRLAAYVGTENAPRVIDEVFGRRRN